MTGTPLEAAHVAVLAAQTSLTAAEAVVTALEADVPVPVPPDPPTPPRSRPLFGSSAEVKSPNNTAQKAFEALEASLVAASGQTGPVLMFDHRYDGATIPDTIPTWWAGKGLRFGLLNGKGPLSPTSSAFDNLPALARSLPAGFTLYAPWWHEPEDNHPADKWRKAFAGYVKAVEAIPASAFKAGASIVPVSNLHGSMFRKGTNMFEKWGPVDTWNPLQDIPRASWPRVVLTVNGYANPAEPTRTPEWTFGPAFEAMTRWGAIRLGICEFGYYPRTSGKWLTDAGEWLTDAGAEIACYFNSSVGSEAPGGWALDTPASRSAYAAVCLSGRRV